VSISSTFFVHFFANIVAPKITKHAQSAFVQNFGAKKVFLYEKCTRKTLMKLTTVRRNLKVSFMTGIEIKLIYDILFVSFTMFCNVSLLFDGLCWCKNTAIKLLRNIIVVCYMSISSTFSERILRWYFGAKKISNPKHSFVIIGAKISAKNARIK